jgi:hypothetical protein
MSETPNIPDPREGLRRYAALISGVLRESTPTAGVGFEVEDQRHVQVERGIVYPTVLLDPARASEPLAAVERLINVATPTQLERLIVRDRTGHARSVYRPLLVYCWLQSFSLAYEILPRTEFGRWEEALRTWCDDLEARLGEFNWPPDNTPASYGDRAAEACWIALVLRLAGKVFIRDAWTDLAGDVFGKLTRRQQESGAFLTPGLSDNPETLWYHELVILHAAASYSVQAEDRMLATAVARATGYHLSQTQPDHATSQPWALFAFIWNPQTRSIADAMLHTQSIHAASGADLATSPVALMLLADALYCLRLFGI